MLGIVCLDQQKGACHTQISYHNKLYKCYSSVKYKSLITQTFTTLSPVTGTLKERNVYKVSIYKMLSCVLIIDLNVYISPEVDKP